MTAIDLFCSADDRHRVILLVDLLERAGSDVALRSEAAHRIEALAQPTDPCLVAVTRRSLREPWVETLFTQAPNVMAMRLDDSPLPWPCARVLDMQTWPARSADRAVASLVQWLQLSQQSAEGATEGIQPRSREGDHPGGTAAGTAAPRGHRVRLRVRAGDKASNSWSGLLALGVLAAAAYLLFLTAPGPRTPDQHTAAAPPEDFVKGVSPEDPVGAAGRAKLERGSATRPRSETTPNEINVPPPADPRATPVAEVSTATEPRGSASPAHPVAAQPVTTSRSASASMAPSQPDAGAGSPASGLTLPPRRPRDALAHLCQARTPEAALAWAGALDWKQRRRLPEEPCIEALLERPGFEGLADRL